MCYPYDTRSLRDYEYVTSLREDFDNFESVTKNKSSAVSLHGRVNSRRRRVKKMNMSLVLIKLIFYMRSFSMPQGPGNISITLKLLLQNSVSEFPPRK